MPSGPHGEHRRAGSRRGVFGLVVVVVAAVWTGAGCAKAKSATAIVAEVDVDRTVPPLLLLRTQVVSQPDPHLSAWAKFVSRSQGDASNLPAPFGFPREMTIAVPASLLGDVVVTVEGLDYEDESVVATASARVQVEAEQATRVSLILTAPGGPIPDAATGDAEDKVDEMDEVDAGVETGGDSDADAGEDAADF